MVKRITLAALAALSFGPLLGPPAVAQVGPDADVYVFGRRDPDRYGYDRRPPPPDDDYDRPRRLPPPPPDYDDDRPRYGRPRRGGDICVTARGDCPTRPGPYNAPCDCEIPGFGFKRGQIGE
ncbi:hypothetical protein [Methylobacterium sp. NEAU K]|uniref:hypothetical protein n=1 Tax=Methylobacterium sp. NEAU K TaxID=3064946 RepID=UPI002732D404|nr:hypothetical protein [Methylobacterium sp. NEAU K]MDP4004253.1 hypothetical protein [Methylobacterium sp. NEAU K]